jgi:hypothetical protein
VLEAPSADFGLIFRKAVVRSTAFLPQGKSIFDAYGVVSVFIECSYCNAMKVTAEPKNLII